MALLQFNFFNCHIGYNPNLLCLPLLLLLGFVSSCSLRCLHTHRLSLSRIMPTNRIYIDIREIALKASALVGLIFPRQWIQFQKLNFFRRLGRKLIFFYSLSVWLVWPGTALSRIRLLILLLLLLLMGLAPLKTRLLRHAHHLSHPNWSYLWAFHAEGGDYPA